MIITEPFGSTQQVIAVFLTSKKPNSDLTVVLSSGDHRFIKHDTVISYADARIFNKENIIIRIRERDFQPHDSLSNDMISAIQEGLIVSPRTPRNIKKIFRDYQEETSN